MTKPKVTFNIMVKNEEAGLERCLASVADIVDEIVVVDTGSTDRTKEIAAQFTDKVYDFVWCEDFSKVRNECLRHSTGDWILWIDGDEYFDEDNQKKLKELVADLPDENLCYMMRQVNAIKASPGEEIYFGRPALFRRLPDIYWTHRVHEQILPQIESAGGLTVMTDLRIMHYGYFEADVHEKKVERNIRILHMDLLDHPNDPFIIFHLGLMYQSLRRYAEALPWWELLVRVLPRGHAFAVKGYALWGEALIVFGQPGEAMRVAREAVALYPQDPEIKMMYGRVMAGVGQLNEAERMLVELINGENTNHQVVLASASDGLHTYRARSLLGEIYLKTNRRELAKEQFEAALLYNPSFGPALQGLALLGRS